MTAPNALLLGVDGGGTSTVAWVALAGGRVIGRGRAGPSNAKAVGVDAARAALGVAVAGAFADAGLPHASAAVGCLGLAGFDRPDDRALLEEWNQAAGWADRLELVNDGDLVVAAGTPEGVGVGVIAGTGSIAVGRAADGRKARAGGWGHLIGDEGSGYQVVLSALRLVARKADGRDSGPPGVDLLADRLCRALGTPSPALMVSRLYAPGFDRSRIAGLASEVLAAVVQAPDLEGLLLRPAGLALGEQALAVARALGFSPGPLALALAGGFLLAAPAVSRTMEGCLAGAGFEVLTGPVPEPVRGAVVLADRALRRSSP